MRHLVALAAIAREGSFRRAADRLGYVQSAISGQIAQLERAAGARLLERASGAPTVRLTDAGRVLLEHTHEIVGRLDAAYADLGSLAQRRGGIVRIAGLERFSPRQLARVVRLFRQRQPWAELLIRDGIDDHVAFELLASDALDLVVCELPLAEGRFGHVVLGHDRYVLLVRAGRPQAHRVGSASVAEIRSLRLMVPSTPGIRDPLQAVLSRLGIEPRSPLKPPSVAIAQALVGAGLGEAIVPWRLVDHADAGTVAVELPDLVPEHTLAMAWDCQREQAMAVRDFIRAGKVGYSAERALTYGRAQARDESPTAWQARDAASERSIPAALTASG